MVGILANKVTLPNRFNSIYLKDLFSYSKFLELDLEKEPELIDTV